MTNGTASERATALINEVLDVLRRPVPDSPVNSFIPAKHRRELRRRATRLRRGQAEPRYGNLYTAEQLAGIYERTAQRDEILEQKKRDFERVGRDLRLVLAENDPDVDKAIDALLSEMKRAAIEQGPDSEAAQRYVLCHYLGWLGRRAYAYERRQRVLPVLRIPTAEDPSVEARYQLTASEILTAPPSPEEAIITIPPDGSDFGQGRLLFRIGLGEASWVGSFARGCMSSNIVLMMPGGKHLFVSAAGAGYVIDLQSRTLVEAIGTEVAGVNHDEHLTLFVVNHNGRSLEAFGRNGRLWKTDTISCGGFREMGIADNALVGEARPPSRPRWAPFSVQLATGEVRFEDAV